MGILLHQWCEGSQEPLLPPQLQQRIDACNNIEELNLLLFQEEVDNEQIAAFTRRRLELEGYDRSIIPLITLPSLQPAA